MSTRPIRMAIRLKEPGEDETISRIILRHRERRFSKELKRYTDSVCDALTTETDAAMLQLVRRCGNCMWCNSEARPPRTDASGVTWRHPKLCVETDHHYIWDRRAPDYPSHKVVNPGWFGCGFHTWRRVE